MGAYSSEAGGPGHQQSWYWSCSPVLFWCRHQIGQMKCWLIERIFAIPHLYLASLDKKYIASCIYTNVPLIVALWLKHCAKYPSTPDKLPTLNSHSIFICDSNTNTWNSWFIAGARRHHCLTVYTKTNRSVKRSIIIIERLLICVHIYYNMWNIHI